MKILKYKKRIYYFIGSLIIAIIVSFLLANQDAIENIYMGNENRTIDHDFITYNWTYQEKTNTLVSDIDPQIIIKNLNIYINDITLNLKLAKGENTNIILYYQEKGDTDFTAEKSIKSSFNPDKKEHNLYLKKYVQALRIDLTEEPGVSLDYKNIEINPHHILYSFEAGLFCILIYSLFIIVFLFRHFILEIWDSRDILKTLILNDLKSRYAGSFLGMIWAFVQPILTIAVFWYVFQLGFKNPPVNNIAYILWFIPAYIPWMYFSDVATNAVGCIREYSYLVKKMKFKVSVLPIIKVCSSFLIHVCFIVFMFIVFSVYRQRPQWMYLQLIDYCFMLSLFLIGLSWLISAISVFVKDFVQIINVVLQLGFFMIPVFWNPEAMSAKILTVLELNPIYYIVQGYRESMIDGLFFWHSPKLTIYYWIITLLVFIIGAKMFDKVRVHFADML